MRGGLRQLDLELDAAAAEEAADTADHALALAHDERVGAELVADEPQRRLERLGAERAPFRSLVRHGVHAATASRGSRAASETVPVASTRMPDGNLVVGEHRQLRVRLLGERCARGGGSGSSRAAPAGVRARSHDRPRARARSTSSSARAGSIASRSPSGVWTSDSTISCSVAGSSVITCSDPLLVEVRRGDRAGERLARGFDERRRVARRRGAVADRLEDRAEVADRDALAQELLEDALDVAEPELLGDDVLDRGRVLLAQRVEQLLRLLTGQELGGVARGSPRSGA